MSATLSQFGRCSVWDMHLSWRGFFKFFECLRMLGQTVTTRPRWYSRAARDCFGSGMDDLTFCVESKTFMSVSLQSQRAELKESLTLVSCHISEAVSRLLCQGAGYYNIRTQNEKQYLDLLLPHSQQSNDQEPLVYCSDPLHYFPKLVSHSAKTSQCFYSAILVYNDSWEWFRRHNHRKCCSDGLGMIENIKYQILISFTQMWHSLQSNFTLESWSTWSLWALWMVLHTQIGCRPEPHSDSCKYIA